MKETLGQKIARLRKELGLTQDDLAKRFNISTQAVSKWENDLSSPDISILKDLANCLGVTIDELLSNEIKEAVTYVPANQRKDINKMILKIRITSFNNDKVNVNLPMSIVIACVNSGMEMPKINENDALKNINFKEIIALVEQGVVGELVNIESAQGDTIIITIE